MRALTMAIAALVVSAISASAQIRSVETTTTVDSASGRTVTTYSTAVRTEEDITVRNNMVVINPLKFFLFYNLSYFRALSNNIAVGGGFQVPTLSELSGFGVNAEMRFHPSGKALRGFYIAPNVSYTILSENSQSAGAFSVGALAGWQWFPGDEFAIGLGIGVDRWILWGSNDNDVALFDSYTGTTPALRFDIGYAW